RPLSSQGDWYVKSGTSMTASVELSYIEPVVVSIPRFVYFPTAKVIIGTIDSDRDSSDVSWCPQLCQSWGEGIEQCWQIAAREVHLRFPVNSLASVLLVRQPQPVSCLRTSR